LDSQLDCPPCPPKLGHNAELYQTGPTGSIAGGEGMGEDLSFLVARTCAECREKAGGLGRKGRTAKGRKNTEALIVIPGKACKAVP